MKSLRLLSWHVLTCSTEVASRVTSVYIFRSAIKLLNHFVEYSNVSTLDV